MKVIRENFDMSLKYRLYIAFYEGRLIPETRNRSKCSQKALVGIEIEGDCKIEKYINTFQPDKLLFIFCFGYLSVTSRVTREKLSF